MTTAVERSQASRGIDLVTFTVGSARCGLDILHVQEINRLTNWTPVPHAPEYVLGILSLRGSIVTVIDLAMKLELGRVSPSPGSRILVVSRGDESVGLLVDRIGDIVHASVRDLSPAPANVNGIHARFIRGVMVTSDTLIARLDVEHVLGDHD